MILYDFVLLLILIKQYLNKTFIKICFEIQKNRNLNLFLVLFLILNI